MWQEKQKFFKDEQERFKEGARYAMEESAKEDQERKRREARERRNDERKRDDRIEIRDAERMNKLLGPVGFKKKERGY